MPAAGRPRFRRRQWIVNRPFQYRFTAVLLLVLCVLTVTALGGVYFALWTILRVFELLNDAVTVSLFTTVGLCVVLEFLIIAPAVAWFGILLTHRVAGPLVRIQSTLTKMCAGDFDVHLTLRKGDALTELADTINRLAEFLRSRKT